MATPARSVRSSSVRASTPRTPDRASIQQLSPVQEKEIRGEVERALVAQRERKARLLGLTSTEIVKYKVNKDVIRTADIPKPGQKPIEISADEYIVEEPSGTTDPQPKVEQGHDASPAFGGFKISLNPGDLVPSHSRTRTSSSRSHAPAAKLSSTSSGTSPASSVTFVPPPNPEKPQDGSPHPPGFFSFSGFGAS